MVTKASSAVPTSAHSTTVQVPTSRPRRFQKARGAPSRAAPQTVCHQGAACMGVFWALDVGRRYPHPLIEVEQHERVESEMAVDGDGLQGDVAIHEPCGR